MFSEIPYISHTFLLKGVTEWWFRFIYYVGRFVLRFVKCFFFNRGLDYFINILSFIQILWRVGSQTCVHSYGHERHAHNAI